VAQRSGSRTMVGLQGRLAPTVLKIREVLQSGRIGKVLSSEVRASGGTMDREFASPAVQYFADRSIGGNVLTIGFGHCKSGYL
jgi:predicted dehydrogenase